MADVAFSLLAASPEDLRRKELPGALASALDLTAIDAGMILRKSRGILRENLTRAEAKRLAGLLGDAGIGTRILPGAVVAALPPARVLDRIEPAPEGIRILIRAGGEEVVAWERLAVLSLGSWVETRREDREARDPPRGASIGWQVAAGVAEVGLSVALGHPVIHVPIGGEADAGRDRRPRFRTEFRTFLDLLLMETEDRLRVDGDSCDFSGLGKAMAPTGQANIKALTAALAAAVPGARRSEGTERLLRGGKLTSVGYRSEEEFLREQRWLRCTPSRAPRTGAGGSPRA